MEVQLWVELKTEIHVGSTVNQLLRIRHPGSPGPALNIMTVLAHFWLLMSNLTAVHTMKISVNFALTASCAVCLRCGACSSHVLLAGFICCCAVNCKVLCMKSLTTLYMNWNVYS